jgi:NhaP-type Na+/H+ or K+/H+ antiporter
VLLLFADAARVDIRSRRGLASLPVRLLGIGMPLTIVLGALIGMVVLGSLSFQEAALLATILAPTDAALGQAVVGNPHVPARIRQALNVEAGLNDGMSMPFLAVFLTMAEAEVQAQPIRVWLAAAGAQIGFGTLVGVIVGLGGGWLVTEARRRGWMTGTYMSLGLLTLAVITWLAATALGGNGFIAAFVAGLAVGMAVFFVFGALAGPLLQGMSWQVALYAILSLTLIRMVPMALSLAGMRRRPVVVATVLLSILVHGATSVPLSRRYARLARGFPEDAPESRGTTDFPTRLGHVDTSEAGLPTDRQKPDAVAAGP